MSIKKLTLFFFLVSITWTASAVDVEFPLIQALVYHPYSDHLILNKSQVRVSLNIYHTNVYSYDYNRTNINDMETATAVLGAGYGLSDRFTLEMYYRGGGIFGGILDKLIIDFHDFFGLKEGGRFDYPRNRVNYKFKNAFAYTGSQFIQSPLVFGILGNIFKKNGFQLNGRLAVGVPLSSRAGLSGKPFVAAGLALLYRENKFSLDLSTHVSFFKNPQWLKGEDIRHVILHSELRIGYRRVFGGFFYRSTPFKWGDLSNPASGVYLGFKMLKIVEFSLVEEFPPMDTTPDVSFHIKINIIGN